MHVTYVELCHIHAYMHQLVIYVHYEPHYASINLTKEDKVSIKKQIPLKLSH